MNEETADTIARLDRAMPPPGYDHHGQDQLGNWIVVRHAEVIGHVGPRGISIMWEHYEARHDPPGMRVYRDDEGDAPTWLWYIAVGESPAIDGGEQDHEVARAAAWAWYWRRVALSLAMESSGIEVYKAVWPACLAWPEETVAHHEAAMRLLGNISEQLQEMMNFRGIVPWKP